MRAPCVDVTAAVPAVIALAPGEGGTVCEVRLLGRCPQRAVEVRELDENPGLPISVTFDAVSRRVREELLTCSHEPIWVEHWPARAVTAVLLERPTVAVRHLVRRTRLGWEREPLTREALARLVAGQR